MSAFLWSAGLLSLLNPFPWRMLTSVPGVCIGLIKESEEGPLMVGDIIFIPRFCSAPDRNATKATPITHKTPTAAIASWRMLRVDDPSDSPRGWYMVVRD